MPPAKPSIIHMRASAAGLAAARNVLRPAWYMAMLSGASLSQPSSPCTSLPASPFCWKPVESVRDWWSSRIVSARSQISFIGRKDCAWLVMEPLFMPIQMQFSPPAALVARLFRSQISRRRA